jgi:hypothetical protein
MTSGHMEEMEWSLVCFTGVFVNYGVKYCVWFYCTFIVNLVIHFHLFMNVFFSTVSNVLPLAVLYNVSVAVVIGPKGWLCTGDVVQIWVFDVVVFVISEVFTISHVKRSTSLSDVPLLQSVRVNL